MTIIYLVTPDIDGTEHLSECLKDFLFRVASTVFVYSLEKRLMYKTGKEYLKLVIPDKTPINDFCQKLRILSSQYKFDFFIKPEQIPANGIIAFDMDSTFMQEEGVDEIAKAVGITSQVSDLTQQAMEGKIDFNTSFTRRIHMLKGTPVEVLNTVCDEMTLSPGIALILPVLKQKGFKIAIISGGLDIFANRIKEKYQLDYAFSNTVSIHNNRLTGKVSHPIMNAAMKKKTLLTLAEIENISHDNIIACGDGANDLPMLIHAGTGIAWKAKSVVRDRILNQINYHTFESLQFFIEEQL